MISLRFAAPVALIAFAATLICGACSTKEPTPSTYFELTISHLLVSSCVRPKTGAACHVADPKGNAFGNLDLSTFDGISHRRQLLVDSGRSGEAALLPQHADRLA